MRGYRSLLASVMMAIIVIGSVVAGSHVLQDEVEQRISGLEARVTVLEKEVAALQDDNTLAGGASETKTYTIRGQLQLRQDYDEPVIFRETSGYCSGTRGYDDIHTGSNVVILDGSGTTLATTSLKTKVSEVTRTVCEFEFSVKVSESDFYTLKICRRGAPTYSLEELKENNWVMKLSIGS